MLSDEERQAIKILKINPEIIADLDEEMFEKMCEFKEKSIKELKYWASQTILNLIEKQSKEIEELKDTRSIFNMGRRSYKNEIEDKIKAKIEEAEERLKKANCLLDCKTKFKVIFKIETEIEVLQSLLEKE